MKRYILLIALFVFFSNAYTQKKKKVKDNSFDKISVNSLKWRSVGPALTSGRISDLAVNPNNPFEYYVAVASGGVWKTSNWGVDYTPIFDSQSSYSIGCITIDPNNPNIVWVGTGENNNQRSVAYGDGVYPFYEADDLHALELVLFDCKSYLADEQPLDQLLIDSGRIASIQDTSLSPYFGPVDVGPRVNIAF